MEVNCYWQQVAAASWVPSQLNGLAANDGVSRRPSEANSNHTARQSLRIHQSCDGLLHSLFKFGAWRAVSGGMRYHTPNPITNR